MNPTLLRQTRPKNCGQTAVAMLTGKTIQEIEKVYGHKTATYPWQHMEAVKKLGFYPDERGFQKYTGQELPPLALVRVCYLKRTRGGGFSTSGKTKRSGHLVLWTNNQFYDPNGRIWTLDTIPPGTKIDTVLEVLAP